MSDDQQQDGLFRLAAIVADTDGPGGPFAWAEPAEHCGSLPPLLIGDIPGLDRECALRPLHRGSHANRHGERWTTRPAPAPPTGRTHLMLLATLASGLAYAAARRHRRSGAPRH
ncbi:hypothetical protein [Streptomyces sp. AD55]|uniref:hypothetical protein n=1 Tax=Streptomyces sp. AD55 TaxID=3242895 RepID=UPI00352818FB